MELSISDIRELLGGSNSQDESPYVTGEKYLIRCVTMFYTGRIIRETANELVLDDTAWIASTGRFHDALKTGKLDEVEPFVSPVIIPKSTIVDASVWTHDLPRSQS